MSLTNPSDMKARVTTPQLRGLSSTRTYARDSFLFSRRTYARDSFLFSRRTYARDSFLFSRRTYARDSNIPSTAAMPSTDRGA